MTTWAEWFAYLDGRLEGSIGGQLPEIDEFIQGSRHSCAEPGMVAKGRPAHVLDELGSTTLFLDYLVESAAASHLLAASLLYSQGRGASWLPAALPNSEESRLVKRAVLCSDRCAVTGASDRGHPKKAGARFYLKEQSSLKGLMP